METADQIDLAAGLAFPGSLREMHSQSEVAAAFVGRIAPFGYTTYAIGSLPDPMAPGPTGFIVHNWPDIWDQWYFDRQFGPDDPARIAVTLNHQPVTISEIRAGMAGFIPSAKGLEMLDAAAELGRGDGLIVPIFGANGYRGIAAVTGTCPDPPGPVRALLHLWALYVHNRLLELQPTADSLPHGAATLSPREIEVLRGAGSGMDDEAIAKRLEISVRTVRFHFENARRKLHCKTRPEAVATAANLYLLGG